MLLSHLNTYVNNLSEYRNKVQDFLFKEFPNYENELVEHGLSNMASCKLIFRLKDEYHNQYYNDKRFFKYWYDADSTIYHEYKKVFNSSWGQEILITFHPYFLNHNHDNTLSFNKNIDFNLIEQEHLCRFIKLFKRDARFISGPIPEALQELLLFES